MMRVVLFLQLVAAVEITVKKDEPLPTAPPNKLTVGVTENANLARDLETSIEREGNMIVTTLQDTADKNVASFQQSLDDATGEIQKMKATQEESLETIRNEQGDSLESLQKKIMDANKQEANHYKEIVQIQNEVKGQANEVDKALENTQSSVELEVSRLHKQSLEFPEQLGAEVRSATDRSSIKAAEIEKNTKKRIGAVKREVDSSVSDLQKTLEENANKLKAQLSSVTVKLTAERVDTAKEVNNDLEDSLAKQSQVETELANTAAEAQSVRELANRQSAEINSKLAKEADTLKTDLDQANDIFTSAKNQVQTTTNSQVSKMKDDVVTALQKAEETIKTEMNTKLADVQKGIQDGAQGVAETNELLTSNVKILNEQIKDNRGQVDAAAATLDELKKHMAATEANVHSQMAETRTVTQASIADVDAYVKEEIAKTDEDVKARAKKAQVATDEALTNAKGSLTGQIDSLKANLGSMMASADEKAEASNAKAESLLDKMETVKSDIRAEKDAVNQAVPHVKAAVQAAVGSVTDSINKVDEELASSKGAVEKEIAESQRAITEESQKQVTDANDELRAQLGSAEEKMSTKMNTMMTSLGQLKAESNRETDENNNAQGQLRASLASGVERATKIADDSEAKGKALELKIADAAKELQSAQQDERRETRNQAESLGQTAQGRIRAAEQSAAEQMHAAIAKSNEQLASFEKSASSTIANDVSKLDSFQTDAAGKIGTLSTKVKSLGFALEKRELATERTNHDLAEKLSDISRNQALLEAKSSAAGGEEKKEIAQKAQELSKIISDKVADMSGTQQLRIKEMQEHTSKAFQQEKAREQSEQSQVSNTVNDWAHNMKREISSVDKNVASIHSGLNLYKTSESEAEKRFSKEVKDLGAEIHNGQKQVQTEVEAEDTKVGKMMATELSGMDGLLGMIAQTQTKFATEVKGMKSGFSKELDSYAKQGKDKSELLSEKLAHLESSAEKLAKGFNSDSSDARTSLAHTQDRLNHVVNETESQMDDFRSEIRDVRTHREEEATKIHEESSALKNEMTTEMGQAVERIEAMRSDTSRKFDALSAEQEQYDKKLAAMIGTANNRDQGQINSMQAKISELEGNNQKLREWQTTFKRKTSNWRQDVEHRIHELTAPGGDNHLRIASLLETSSTSEVQRLRSLQEKLQNDNSHLSTDEKSLEERAKHLEEVLKAHGITPVA